MLSSIEIIISLAMLGIIIWLGYRNISLKTELKFHLEELDSLRNNFLVADQAKISNIQIISQLSSKIEYQEKIINDFEKLRRESQELTKAALFDLGNDLSKQLIEVHKRENQEVRLMSEKNIKETSEKFNSEFERLINMVGALGRDVERSQDTVDIIKNSLLSPSGAGKLAEITLENILKSSGLRTGMDFKLQYSVAGEDNSKLRPDAVIFLPSNNIMVLDAKASKFLVDCQGEQTNLAKTMNFHLRSLSSKEYSEYIIKSYNKKGSNLGNVITLMFLPTEHAIEKIMEADNEFMNKAWKANIFPVGPAGLMNMLSFAKFQISEQMMLYNHQLIIEEVKKLISSIAIMADHSSRLGGSISSLVNHYDKFAGSFNHNFLSKVRSINRLGISGANTSKGYDLLERHHLVSTKSDSLELENEEIPQNVVQLK